MSPLSFARSRFVDTNGIRMLVYENGPADGLPIVFCHGFPELAFSWRHQVGGLGRRGYRAIAPDLRGTGETGRTANVADSSMANLARDLVGLLDGLGIERAVFCGHDMGGLLVYTMALRHPERCLGIVSLNTPYRHRPARNPIELLCETRGGAHYRVVFQKRPRHDGDPRTGIAENVLGADVRKTFRALMRTSERTLADYAEEFPDVLDVFPIGMFVGEPVLGEHALLTEEELDVYVRTYEKTGFTGGLDWYRNIVRNWQPDPARPVPGTPHVHVPCLMITAARDFVIPPQAAEPMRELVDDLETVALDCGHWTQQERPEEVNEAIHRWVRERLDPGRRPSA